MGPLGQGILVALLRAHVWHEDVAEEGRADRLATIAEATESAVLRATCAGQWPALGCRRIWIGSRRRLAALLTMSAIEESGLGRRFHAGQCRGAECDHGTSIGLWQIKRQCGMSEERWRSLAGLGIVETTDSAWHAARILSRAKRRCGTDEGAIAMYATGGGCRWEPAAERLRVTLKIEKRIAAAER